MWNIKTETPEHVAFRLEMPRETLERLLKALTRRKRQAPDIKMLNDFAVSLSAASGVAIPEPGADQGADQGAEGVDGE